MPVYIDTVLEGFTNNEYYRPLNINSKILTKKVEQFTDITIPDSCTIQSDTLIIQGMPMKYSILEGSVDLIRNILYRTKQTYSVDTKTPIRKVGVMFRTFQQEKTPQYRVVDD